MNKVKEIFKAWGIALNPSLSQQNLAAKRLEICNSCEHKTSTAGINRCSVCGCALKGKVFSPVQGACPKGKWDKIDKVMNKETIFVQIASYRDPELINTLDDILDKAMNPDRLKICVAWQHSEEDEWDNIDKYKDDSRFIFLDIPYKESEGACWARNKIQQNYNGEDYTLQLDSHHRFVQGWDVECIQMIKQLQEDGHKKPLLTSYISSFNPENDPEERVRTPWWMTFDRFTPEGVVFFLPTDIPDFANLTKPVPSRFFSAHFCFTLGKFCIEVQHDPTFYFHGEEISLAVRAFTHGYDLFHPHKIVAYHEYTRKGRTKQWDDDKGWVQRNTRTHKKVRQLLGVDNEECTEEIIKEFGKYYLGTERTLEDYEKYAGIRFRDRSIQQHTLDNKFPPNPEVEDYENSFLPVFKHCIDVHKNSLTEKDYDFIAVIFEREDGSVIYRKDANEAEARRYVNQKEEWINIWRTYNGEKPYKWIVWPHSKAKGWMEKIEKIL